MAANTPDYLTELLHLALVDEDGIDFWQTQFDQARKRWQLDQAQRLLREAKRSELSQRGLALVRHAEGSLHAQLGDWEWAVKSFMGGIDLLEDSEYVEEGIWVLNDLGMILRLQGNAQGAVAAHQQALTLAREIDRADLAIETMVQLGLDAEQQGYVAKAAVYFQQALAQGETGNDADENVSLMNHLGRIQWLQGDLSAARDTLQDALTSIRQTDSPDVYLMTQIQANLGNVFYRQGNLKGAEAHWQAALEAFNTLNVVYDKGGLLNNLGGLALTQEDYTTASTYFQESLATSRDLGDQRGQGEALTNLGSTMLRSQNWSAAADYYYQALQINLGPHYQRGLWVSLARTHLLTAIDCLKTANLGQTSWVSAGREAYRELMMTIACSVKALWHGMTASRSD